MPMFIYKRAIIRELIFLNLTSKIANTFSGQESGLFVILLDILFVQFGGIDVCGGVEIWVDEH